MSERISEQPSQSPENLGAMLTTVREVTEQEVIGSMVTYLTQLSGEYETMLDKHLEKHCCEGENPPFPYPEPYEHGYLQGAGEMLKQFSKGVEALRNKMAFDALVTRSEAQPEDSSTTAET